MTEMPRQPLRRVFFYAARGAAASLAAMHRMPIASAPYRKNTGKYWEILENLKKNTGFGDFFLYGRWEDLDRWKWLVIDVATFLDTSASHSEICFRHFWHPLPPPPIPQGV